MSESWAPGAAPAGRYLPQIRQRARATEQSHFPPFLSAPSTPSPGHFTHSDGPQKLHCTWGLAGAGAGRGRVEKGGIHLQQFLLQKSTFSFLFKSTGCRPASSRAAVSLPLSGPPSLLGGASMNYAERAAPPAPLSAPRPATRAPARRLELQVCFTPARPSLGIR